MTTVLRYLALLEQDGIIERTPDPSDGRRVFVKLTEHGMSGLRQIFSGPRARSEPASDLKLAA